MSSRKTAATRLEDARARMYQDLIFESAEFVFGQKGYENATMQEVAAEAGVSLKTVYGIFPGKQELYRAIMLARGRAMFEAVAAAHHAAGSPIEKLVSGTRAFVNFLVDHRDWSLMHVRSQISWAMRPQDESARALWEEGQRAQIEMLEEGIAAGVFCDDDPAETALMIGAMTRVQVVHAIETGDADVAGIAERLVSRLLRMLCKERVEAREVG